MKKFLVSVLAVIMLIVLANPVKVYADDYTKEDEEEYDKIYEELEALEHKNVFDCDEYYLIEKTYGLRLNENACARAIDGVWEEQEKFNVVYIHADVDSEWLRQGNTSAIGIVFKWDLSDSEGSYAYEYYNIPEDDDGVYFTTELTYKNNYTRIVNVPKFVSDINEIYCDNLPVTKFYINGIETEMSCYMNFNVATLEFTLGNPLTEEDFVSKYGSISYDEAIKQSIDTEKYPEVIENTADTLVIDEKVAEEMKEKREKERKDVEVIGGRKTDTAKKNVPIGIIVAVGIAVIGAVVLMVIIKKRKNKAE